RRGYDIKSCKHKAQADKPQSDSSYLNHIFRSIKDCQKLGRKQLEYSNAQQHDPCSITGGKKYCSFNPLFLLCSVIKSHDGHHAVIQAKDWHKYKALELKVNTEYSCSRRRKGDQNLIHTKSHH